MEKLERDIKRLGKIPLSPHIVMSAEDENNRNAMMCWLCKDPLGDKV